MARLENLLGASALALTDRLVAAEPEGAPTTGPTERAALVTLLAHPDQPVSWLGAVLGLTASGVTRLVDRLVAAGSVTRVAGTDARSRRVRLTDVGRRRAEAVLHAREAALADVVRDLSPADRAELERLLGLLVGGLTEEHLPALRLCRLCDRDACASGGVGCPLAHTTPAEVARG
ncbi:MarR family winged helix-turn-helix transcriptional regulator [Desertihabitans brevis]|nr:MarR family winged helix-turn-helix transcriptional regulator [Desertihabitans brevis]